MSINPNAFYHLSPDGVNYLTCPNADGAKVTFAPLDISYSTAIDTQTWFLESDGNTIESVYITCKIGGNLYYLTANGTLNSNLVVSKSKPTSNGWSIDINGGITLNFANGNPPQFANKSSDNPAKPIEGDQIFNWTFLTPYEKINVSDKFYISSESQYLTNQAPTNDEVGMSDTIDSVNSVWVITGTYDAAKGLITKAQISCNGYFIYGLEDQSVVNSYKTKKADYNWTIQDTGDQHASFICGKDATPDSSGGLNINAENNSVVTTGPGTRKWKFRKTISNR